jgi:transcriptional regulator
MYSLPYFKAADQAEVLRFMHEHPFAMLCGSNNAGMPVVTQVPVLLKEESGQMIIEGHIMKNTDHHRAFIENDQALFVFTGAHTYVSASLYSNPNQASTWNYMSVHARGRMLFLGEDELRNILRETTEKYEQGKESLASYHHLQPEYIDKLIKAIIGFRVVVDSIENVFKLSQNRDEKSFHSIMGELREGDDRAKTIADEMERIKDGLFNK